MQILNDFNTSVKKALSEIDPNWESYEGLITCGTHSPDKLDPNQQIGFIEMARKQGYPFLGICFGHQLAAIEYARNVLGIEDATSEEFGGKGTFVVYKLPELNVGLKITKDEPYIDRNGFYGNKLTQESFWNNYEVMPDILARWEKPPNFITCQYHPEYQSSKDNPHPLLVKFIELCKKNGNVE